MFQDKLDVKIDGGYDIEFPKMYKVKQLFNREKVDSIPETVKHELSKEEIKSRIKSGDQVAVAVGSRGS